MNKNDVFQMSPLEPSTEFVELDTMTDSQRSKADGVEKHITLKQQHRDQLAVLIENHWHPAFSRLLRGLRKNQGPFNLKSLTKELGQIEKDVVSALDAPSPPDGVELERIEWSITSKYVRVARMWNRAQARIDMMEAFLDQAEAWTADSTVEDVQWSVSSVFKQRFAHQLMTIADYRAFSKACKRVYETCEQVLRTLEAISRQRAVRSRYREGAETEDNITKEEEL